MLGFKSITVPTSALCGAKLMTDNFVKLLEDKGKILLNDTATLDMAFWESAIQQWETNIMPNFTPRTSHTWTFSLPPASIPAITTRASRLYASWTEKGELPIFRCVSHN